MTENQLKVLRYVLRECKGKFEVNCEIRFPSEEDGIDELTFSSSLFQLSFIGYINSLNVSSDHSFNGFDLRKIIVNVNRESESFKEV